jgi:hypothetical protein
MPGLVPGIHVFLVSCEPWMAGPSPAMTMRLHCGRFALTPLRLNMPARVYPYPHFAYMLGQI